MKLSSFIAVLLIAATSFAADAPKAADAPIPASQAVENAILRAEHAHDQAIASQLQATNNMQQLETQYQQFVTKFTKQKNDADAAEKATSAEIDKAVAAAWTESGLDKSKYDFDAADFKFKTKASAPKAASAAQEKK